MLHCKVGYWPLPTNIKLGWKGLPGANPSLLRNFLNFVRKTFYSIGPWGQCYKTFLSAFTYFHTKLEC
jgi:hypothetical protein